MRGGKRDRGREERERERVCERKKGEKTAERRVEFLLVLCVGLPLRFSCYCCDRVPRFPLRSYM